MIWRFEFLSYQITKSPNSRPLLYTPPRFPNSSLPPYTVTLCRDG